MVQKIETATHDCDLCIYYLWKTNQFKVWPSTDPKKLVRDIMGYGGRMQHVPPQIW